MRHTTILDLREQASESALALRNAMPQSEVGSPEESLRLSAIPTWLGRMRNEHGSSRVFQAMSEHAHSLGYSEFAQELATFAEEEIRHGVLCGAIATALGGTALTEALPQAQYPLHSDAKSSLESLLRNVVSVSCMSETVAVALIGAELEAMKETMPDAPITLILEQIWADEIGHSRVGWRFLHVHAAQLEEESRLSLCAYVTHALNQLEEHELAHLPLNASPPPGGARYGLCSGAEARILLHATVEQVILPSLALAGLKPAISR